MVKQVVRPPTLTLATAEAIREAIFSGELRPGEPLREGELAQLLRVSRSTAREALRLLQEEGLVEIFPHRGAFVRELSPQTAHEVYTLRALLEPYAVRIALEKQAYTPGDLAHLEALAQRLGELELQQGQIYERVKTDVEFHYLLCQRSDHQLLLQMYRTLQSLTWLFVYHFHIYRSAPYSDEPSHYEIFQAIREGEPARAEEVLKHHIEAAGRALLKRMEEADWQRLAETTSQPTAEPRT
ncbi:MAG: GntR family transcriptional regulator [Anaerolineae bacterium]